MRVFARIVLMAAAFAFAAEARSQACGPRGCPPSAGAAGVAPDRHGAVVRIAHDASGSVSRGSGTLVGHGQGGSYLLTCAHLFDGGPGETRVRAGGVETTAKVVAVDRPHDLAVLRTPRINASPAVVAEAAPSGGLLTACGYGPNGAFRCVRGPLVGYATPRGAESPSLRLRGAVRPGDSGGPVFDASGRLVAVVWGQRGGESYASFGAPLRRLLQRVTRGDAPLAPVPRRPEAPAGDPYRGWRERVDRGLAETRAGLKELGDRLEGHAPFDAEGFATRRELESAAASWRTEVTGVEGRIAAVAKDLATVRSARSTALAWAPTLAAGLGVGGPIGVALLAGRLLAARWKRAGASSPSASLRSSPPSSSPSPPPAAGDRVVAVDSPPPPQHVVPETHFVAYERDEFAKAHQWASEQLARKFPGAVEMLASLDSLIKQQLAAAEQR